VTCWKPCDVIGWRIDSSPEFRTGMNMSPRMGFHLYRITEMAMNITPLPGLYSDKKPRSGEMLIDRIIQDHSNSGGVACGKPCIEIVWRIDRTPAFNPGIYMSPRMGFHLYRITEMAMNITLLPGYMRIKKPRSGEMLIGYMVQDHPNSVGVACLRYYHT